MSLINVNDSNQYIFFIPEIEEMIFNYLNPLFDYQHLILVNKHYFEMFSNHPIIIELRNFYLKASNKTSIYQVPVSDKWGCAMERYEQIITGDIYRQQFAKACINNCIFLAKYIYSKHLNEIKNGLYFDIFLQCCKDSHLEILKFIVAQELINKSGMIFYSNYFITKNCETNNIKVAQWLYSLGYHSFPDEMDDELFVHACKNGHIDTAKFLLSIDKSINIHRGNDNVFRSSCANGHLEMVKYLLSLDGKIDISTNKQEAFRKSCDHGHLEVAKYLYENYGNIIKIRKFHDSAFRTACINSRMDVAMWLTEICPVYKIYPKPGMLEKYKSGKPTIGKINFSIEG